MESGYDNEAATSTKVLAKVKTPAEIDEDVRRAHKERQTNFLTRDSLNTRFGSWRPKKKHRNSGKLWCRVVDSQFRISTEREGLSYFEYDKDDDEWQEPGKWPWVGIAIDLGSSGVTGLNAFERLFKLNCDLFNDQNHACNCDWNGMLNHTKMMGWMILNLTSFNVPFGPRMGERLREHQMRACLDKMYMNYIPSQVPLFGKLAKEIIDAIAVVSEPLPFVEDPEVEAWKWMKERARLARFSKSRTHLSRFSAAPYALVKHAEAYPMHEFERTYLCLEMDFLGSNKLVKILKAAHIGGDEHDEDIGPTDSKSRDEQLVRSTSANACVVSYQMFSNHTNKRYTLSYAEIDRKMIKFHTYQNVETRDSDRTFGWHDYVINGGYMEHVCEIVGLLQDVCSLERAGYAVDDADIEALGDDVESENQFADLHAQSIFTLAGWRQRRNLSMVMGWWKRLARLKSEKAAATMKEFKVDYEDDVHINGLAKKSAACQEVQSRSLFQKSLGPRARGDR